MSRAPLKWALALVLSGALHAGAAVVLAPGEEQEQVEGGASTELAMLGNTFADQVSAGDASEVAEPVETEVTDAASQAATAEPVEPEQTTQPQADQAVEAPAETADTLNPTTSEPELPATQAKAASASQAEQVDISEATPTQVIEEIDPAVQTVIAALTPPAQQEAAEPVEASPVAPEIVEPVEEMTEVAAIVNIPLPSPRPDYTPVVMPRAEKPKVEPQRQAQAPQQKKAQTPPSPKKSGSGGQNQADARKGTSDGSTKGTAATQGNKGNSQAGNAAVSNYPSKVRSKLSRALRSRGRDSGEVHVTFVVNKSGAVNSVRIARSSGKPALDQAAIDAVRRAAPFPPIPDGRASWPFTIPLAFTR